jgi:hypothetical protein
MGFMDEFRHGRAAARAARDAPNTGGDDDFDALGGDAGQHSARIAELEAALRERDGEAAKHKQLIADLKEFAEQLQARVAGLETVAAPLVAVLLMPGVKAMLVNRFHPDKHPEANAEQRAAYGEALSVINESYTVVDKVQA